MPGTNPIRLRVTEQAFSILNMRSTDDRSTRARIRDAAVLRFAADGLDAPLRAVARDAEVSPGLILHHFGSRAGLMAECDQYVLDLAMESKTDVMGKESGPSSLLMQITNVEEYAPAIAYVLRCMQAGGEITERFVDLMTENTAAYLETGVREGTISPSRAPEERARILAEMSLGSLMVELPARKGHIDLDEFPAWLEEYLTRVLLPLLEMFTEPLLTDSSLLDTYLAATEGNPS